MSRALFALAALAALTALPAHALAQAAQPLEPAISPTGSLLQVFVGLIFVLLLIVATGWVTRRFGIARGGAGNVLHVVSSAPVGTRERVVVIEVGETWIVVGVAPGSVNALLTLPRGEAPAAGTRAHDVARGALSPFKEKLQQMLDKRREK
ncbi:MAG: flagellar biosynthetic protein FliO [Gammaproteobacteria bacterium]